MPENVDFPAFINSGMIAEAAGSNPVASMKKRIPNGILFFSFSTSLFCFGGFAAFHLSASYAVPQDKREI